MEGCGRDEQVPCLREVTAIDPARLEAAKAAAGAKKAETSGQTLTDEQKALAAALTPAQQTAVDSDITGNRQTLKVDSLIPATMAVCFLLLILYFKAIGGYRPLSIDEQH